MENLNILKGAMYITSDEGIARNFPLGPGNKIINLDEDEILDIQDPNIIGGSCLLPPMLAKIAEADGDEYSYEMLYKDHLVSPYQQEFLAALFAGLYKGINLLIFLTEIGCTYTLDKLCLYLFQLYGIHTGVLDIKQGQIVPTVPCWYDNNYSPIWLNLIYEARVMTGYEYLIQYPVDADLRANEKIMGLLINELRPYADTIQKRIDIIVDLHKKLHKNPNVRMPIKQVLYL